MNTRSLCSKSSLSHVQKEKSLDITDKQNRHYWTVKVVVIAPKPTKVALCLENMLLYDPLWITVTV